MQDQWDSFAGELAVPVPPVTINTSCSDVFDSLMCHPDWPAVAVLGRGKGVVGIVSRSACLSILARPIMLDLYSRRPVERIMRPSPLVVDRRDNLDVVGARITRDCPDALVDGFVVADGADYFGVASPVALMARTVDQAQRRAACLEEARHQAEAANRAKSSFVASLSHELRTPLNGVIANLELLVYSRLDRDQSALVTAANAASQTLLGLIGNVLDFSKIEAGRLALECRPVQPARILEEVVALMGAQARHRNLDLAVLCPPSGDVVITGDSTRLHQIMLNLIGNALKFTVQGGVFALLEGRKDSLVLEIHDTGKGFDPVRAEDLFHAFVQEDAATTRQFGGTGLGLAISRSLIQMMGGSLEADGAPGGGASFICTWPVAAEDRISPANEGSEIAGLRVLLVANSGEGDALEPLLRGAGADVVHVRHAVAALGLVMEARVSGGGFDVALIDGATGDEVFSLPNLLAPYPVVPVMLTGRRDVVRRRRGFLVGYRHMHVLPSRAEDLIWTVAHAAARTRIAPPPLTVLPAVREFAARMATLAEPPRVLVVDDNAMNQSVAQRQLATLGLASEVAEHGLAALEQLGGAQLGGARLVGTRFDLVLCDCQMPQMDGFTFARTLRQREVEAGTPRLPVIAMTANALAGVREQCLAAGMDNVITKPVRLSSLLESLRVWLAPVLDAVPVRESAPIGAAVDLQALSEIIGYDDPAALVETLDLFLSVFPEVWGLIADALAAGDRMALHDAAHAAKGAARTAAAVMLGETLAQLERDALAAPWPHLASLVTAADRHFDDVRAELASLKSRSLAHAC